MKKFELRIGFSSENFELFFVGKGDEIVNMGLFVGRLVFI